MVSEVCLGDLNHLKGKMLGMETIAFRYMQTYKEDGV